MKKILFGLLVPLLAVIITPLFVSAAPALDSIPNAIKSNYSFNGQINTAVSDGTTLYVGGSFSTITLNVDGDPPEYEIPNLAAFDLTDPSYPLIAEFNPQPNYTVNALALDAHGTLYIGGYFTCLGAWDEGLGVCGGDTRNYLAAVDAGTGDALPAFDIQPDNTVFALALNSDDSVLYVGGSFIAGDAEYLAAYDTSGYTLTVFDAGLDSSVYAIALSSDNSTLYATGDFSLINDGIQQGQLAAFNSTTGVATDFNATISSGGSVLTLSSDDSVLYVGGFFDSFRLYIGEGVPFNETTQEPIATYPKVFTQGDGGGGGGATVYAAIPDGDGGWYIGGSFTHVGTTSQPLVAHITSGGLFDGSFNPIITDAGGGEVYTLELYGTTLYVGGSFIASGAGFTGPGHLAAFDTTDGSLDDFYPYIDATVYDLEISSNGTTLYVGGSFNELGDDDGDENRWGVGAYDTTGIGGLGAVTAFDPDISTGGFNGLVNTIELSADDNTLFVGGDFDAVKYGGVGPGTARTNIAAFTTAGAGAVAAFDPNANGAVYDLQLSGVGTLYAGGAFSVIGGENRHEFAELNTTTGSATGLLDAGIVGGLGTVLSIATSTDGATVYIGGENFSEIGGLPRNFFGEIYVTGGSTGDATDFNPRFNDTVRTISVDTETEEMFIGGSFTGMGSESVSNLIAIDTSDSSLITAFDPEVNNTVRTLSLSSDDTLLYVGGDFTDVNSGTTREYLAALDTADGAATAFNPTGEVFYGYAIALKANDTELYFGSYDADDTGSSELLIFDAGEGVDETPPVITLLGDAVVELVVGGSYTDAGATAEDDVDGDITDDIVVGGDAVDPDTVGTYIITYNVSDAAGNPADEVTRTVNVVVDLNVDGDDDDGNNGNNGGSGSSRVRTVHINNPIVEILSKLIVTLQELIALTIAQRQN